MQAAAVQEDSPKELLGMLFSSVQTDGAAIARQDGSSSGRFLFRRRVAVGVSYPADDPPDRQHHRRYQNRHHRRHAVVNDRNALEQVAEKTHDVIRNCRDRQAFDGLLKAQLQLGPVVHRSQQIAVLAFKFDVDPRTQQRDGSGQFVGELGLALLTDWHVRMAGAMRRCRKSAQVLYPDTATSESAASLSSTIS